MKPDSNIVGDLIVVSVTGTLNHNMYLTLWRPGDCGYSAIVGRAGRYTREKVSSYPSYYNDGENIAVPASLIESLAVPVPVGWFDFNGDAVLNTRENWNKVKAALIWRTQFPVKPTPALKREIQRFDAWKQTRAERAAKAEREMAA